MTARRTPYKTWKKAEEKRLEGLSNKALLNYTIEQIFQSGGTQMESRESAKVMLAEIELRKRLDKWMEER